MAFKLEKISDEDRKKYKLRKPSKRLSLDNWVIDREKESYLIYVTRDSESCTYVYWLFWNNQKVEVVVKEQTIDEKRTENQPTEFHIIRTIEKIIIPSALQKYLSEIKGAITEALISYGWNESLENPSVVDVTSIEKLEIQFQ